MKTKGNSDLKLIIRIAGLSLLIVGVIALVICLYFKVTLLAAVILAVGAALYFPWCYLSVQLIKQNKKYLLYLAAGIIDIFYFMLILVLFVHLNRSATYTFWPTAVMAIATVIITFYSYYDIIKGNDLHWLVRTIPYSLAGCAFIFVLIQFPNTASAFENNSGTQWFFTGLFTFLTFDYIKQVINERIIPIMPTAAVQESAPMKHS